MGIFRTLAFAGVIYWSIGAAKSIVLNRSAYAEAAESWETAARQLTPELYKRDSDTFERYLDALERFLWSKNRSDRDNEIVLDALLENLSLNGDSLAHSVETSERIRQMLVREGSLDFKKPLEQIVDYVSYETGMLQACERYRNNVQDPNDPESIENLHAVRELIEIRKGYRTALQNQAEILKRTMILLSWHYPGDIKGEIDYQGVFNACRETMGAISELSQAVAERNLLGIAKYLDKYNEKHHKAQKLFESNLNRVRRQAAVAIEQNIGVLKWVSHDGYLFLKHRKFADDWEGIGGATQLVQIIQKGGKPEALARKIEPPEPETRIKSSVRWKGMPLRSSLERKLHEITHDREILNFTNNYYSLKGRTLNNVLDEIRDYINKDICWAISHSNYLCLIGPDFIPIIRNGFAQGHTDSALDYLQELARAYQFNEKEKKEFTEIALKCLSHQNPKTKFRALESLYYLEYPGIERLAKNYTQKQRNEDEVLLSETAVSILARLQDQNTKRQLMRYHIDTKDKTKPREYRVWLIGNAESLVFFGTDDVVKYLQDHKIDLSYMGGQMVYQRSAPLLRDFYKIYDDPAKPARKKLEELCSLFSADSNYRKIGRTADAINNLHGRVVRQVFFKINRLPPETAVILYDLYQREQDKRKKSIYIKMMIDVLNDKGPRPN